MANGFKFELNSEGVAQLMKSIKMQNGLIDIAEGIVGRAGDGYGYNVSLGIGDRTTVFVKAETKEAKKDNLENNTILRSLQG